MADFAKVCPNPVSRAWLTCLSTYHPPLEKLLLHLWICFTADKTGLFCKVFYMLSSPIWLHPGKLMKNSRSWQTPGDTPVHLPKDVFCYGVFWWRLWCISDAEHVQLQLSSTFLPKGNPNGVIHMSYRWVVFQLSMLPGGLLTDWCQY